MSRRDLIRMTDEEVDEFLDGRHTMNIATHAPDGTIHLVAMWYGFVDGVPAFETFAKSQKILNLERDPRMTALVEDGDSYDELRGVELVGKGVVTTEREPLMALARDVIGRYQGVTDPDEVEALAQGLIRKRAMVSIEVERVVSWDHRKLAGGY